MTGPFGAVCALALAMHSVGHRFTIEEIAKIDTERAISFSVAIHDPWSACQALAWTLRYAPESAIPRIVPELTHRTAMCADEYQQSAVQAWVVAAFAERDLIREADAILIAALKLARTASPCPSRSEALFLLFQAAHPLGCVRLNPIARMIRDAYVARHHWRSARNLVRALAQLARFDKSQVSEILATCHEPVISARVEREIADRIARPRPFFW